MSLFLQPAPWLRWRSTSRPALLWLAMAAAACMAASTAHAAPDERPGAAQLQPSAGTGAIAFYPDGGASGGRIELIGQRAGWQLDVAWITGQVAGKAIAGERR